MNRPYLDFTSEQEWKDYIFYLLEKNPTALKRAVIHIYRRQTSTELLTGQTSEHNGVGFSKWDSQYLGRIALRILNGYNLSPREEAITKNKMKKYWRQLMDISKERIQEEKDEQRAIEESNQRTGTNSNE